MTDETATETLVTAMQICSQDAETFGHHADAVLIARVAMRLHDQAEEIVRLKDALHYAKGTAELAMEHRDEAERADVFWDDDNPEMAEESIYNVMAAKVENGELSDGDEFTVRMAIRLPKQTFRAIVVAADDDDYDYEPVVKSEVPHGD